MKAQGTHSCAEFLQACKGGCPERIAAAAEAGCDTVARTDDGRTGLMLAVESGSAAAVKAVLELDSTELEARDTECYAAFLWACHMGNTDCIVTLVEAGCDTAARTDKGETGLMLAARSGSAAAIHAVLELDSTELEATDANRHTAFLLACAHDNVDCIVTLVEAGCNTAARNCRGRTGLMLAAGWGSAATVQAVLDLDSTELEAKDELSYTAFLCACGKGNIDCIGALAEAGCDTFADGRIRIRSNPKVQNNAPVGEEIATVAAIAGAHLIQQVAQARELADTTDDDSGCCARAIACLEQAIKDHGASPEATELLHELRERLEQQHEEAERKAKQAEAELMAMIEGGGHSAAAGDAKAVENARKKKQKRQRQKAQAAAATNGPSLEPQTAPLLSNIASSTTMEAKKARKKEKRKRQQEKKVAAKRAAETSVPEPGMESGSQARSSSPPMPADAQEPQSMPEPLAPERPGLQPQSEAPLSPAAESALMLAQLTVEQSVAWLGTVSGLAPDTIEAVGRTFTEHDIDGQELQVMRPKLLRGFLKSGLPDAETRDGAIAAILARRDQQLVAESKPDDCMVCPLSLCLMNDPWSTQVGSTCE
jgi:ankyrin repeat protein